MIMAAMLVVDVVIVMRVRSMVVRRVIVVGMVVVRMIVLRVLAVIMIVVGVIMMRVIVPGMIMAGLGRLRVGTAFRIERRLDLNDFRAEPLQHRLDDVIAADPQALCHQLRRQVAVAEMPSDADQLLRILAADFDQRLGGGHHFDHAAIFQHQRVAAAQRHCVFEIEQELQAAGADHCGAPAMPVVEIQHHGVGRGLIPTMLAFDVRCADHLSLTVLDLIAAGDGSTIAAGQLRPSLAAGRTIRAGRSGLKRLFCGVRACCVPDAVQRLGAAP